MTERNELSHDPPARPPFGILLFQDIAGDSADRAGAFPRALAGRRRRPAWIKVAGGSRRDRRRGP
jgi:hypothetical protein